MNKPFFDKRTTNIIKGVSIFLMFFHHFFTFPEWWPKNVSYPLLENLSQYLNLPSKICVPVFCFISGYFYYYGKNKTFKYSLRKITDILLTYWFVFAVFALIAVVFLNYNYSVIEIVEESFGLFLPTMVFCWYIYFYIILMLLLPVLAKIKIKNVHIEIIGSFVLIDLIARMLKRLVSSKEIIEIISNFNNFLPVAFLGFFFAKYDIFEKIQSSCKQIADHKYLNMLFLLSLSILIPMGRFFEPNVKIDFAVLPAIYVNLDCIYVPIFVYSISCICFIDKKTLLGNTLYYFGKRSFLMWLVHCIFFNNSKDLFIKVLYFSNYPILVYIFGILICLLLSILFDFIISKVVKIKNKLLFNN